MSNISDFKIIETHPDLLKDGFPFHFTYKTDGRNKFCAGFNGKSYYNCKKIDDTRLLVIFDNHGLSRGQLRVERKFSIPDNDFPDRLNNITVEEELNYKVGENVLCNTTNITAIPAYAKGDPGKSAYQEWLEAGNEGTEEDFLASLSLTWDKVPESGKDKLVRKAVEESKVFLQIIVDGSVSAMESKVNDAIEKSNEAELKANYAVTKAETAITQAGNAVENANLAIEGARNTIEAANSAVREAQDATNEARNASQIAQNAAEAAEAVSIEVNATYRTIINAIDRADTATKQANAAAEHAMSIVASNGNKVLTESEYEALSNKVDGVTYFIKKDGKLVGGYINGIPFVFGGTAPDNPDNPEQPEQPEPEPQKVVYFGGAPTWQEVDEHQDFTEGVTTNLSVTVRGAEQKIYFLVPAAMSIASIMMGPFEIPMEQPVTVSRNGVEWKLYESSNTYDAGTFPVVIK